MKPSTRSMLPFLAVLAVLPGSLTVRAQEVTVALLSEAIVDDTIVTLDRVAKLSGGSAALRKRLGKLDLIDFPAAASHRVVTSELVRFRLLLAGMEASEFTLCGARRTTIVEPDEPVTLRKLLAAAEHAVRSRYPGDASGVTVTANKGMVVPVFETHPLDRIRFDAIVNGPIPASGRARVDVSVNVNGKKREVVSVILEIEPRDFGTSIAGSREQPIRPAANWTPAAGANDFLIKARDNVKIVAVIGAARVEAIGEAQQDGKTGQIIRVRNVESNRIVYGRVEANGTVTVEY